MPVSSPFIAPQCHDEIEILYQDPHLLLINKPSKLLSLSGKHPLNIDSVHHRLVKDFPSALMVHRLDLGTSGIMVIALNKQVNKDICQQFAARHVKKTYTALLHGHITHDTGNIDLPIAKGDFPLQKICYQNGKQASSDYMVQARGEGVSRVIFTPRTGRTHQLRIHSREIGHPILGCDLYGTQASHTLSKRLMLHATTLEFTHPLTQEKVMAHCECPF
ncbi:MAG: RluA family pseudouridine synthase [Bermanella sp.]|jgi:Pseudouridylate synthases, 23S RNA-specific